MPSLPTQPGTRAAVMILLNQAVKAGSSPALPSRASTRTTAKAAPILNSPLFFMINPNQSRPLASQPWLVSLIPCLDSLLLAPSKMVITIGKAACISGFFVHSAALLTL